MFAVFKRRVTVVCGSIDKIGDIVSVLFLDQPDSYGAVNNDVFLYAATFTTLGY